VNGERDRRDLLLEAGLALSSERSLPAILQRIVELATQLTGARYGAIGVLGPGGGISELVYTGITPEQHAAIGHLPVGKGVLGALIEDARAPCGCPTSIATRGRWASRPTIRRCGRFWARR
jgi:two-component system, NarL family, sensor histidine kinase DevS